MEEASVAGESPDRSKQRESSAEPTSGSGGSVPEARDPRLAVAREKDSSGGGRDTATKILSVRDLKTPAEAEKPAEAEESAGSEGADAEASADAAPDEDIALRDAVSAWVRGADAGKREAKADAPANTAERRESGADTDAEAGAESADGAEAGTDSEAGASSAADADADTDAGSASRSGAESGEAVQTGTGSKADGDETDKDADGKAKAGAVEKADAAVRSDARVAAAARVKAAHGGANAKAGARSDAGSGAKADAARDTETASKTGAAPTAAADAPADSERKSGGDAGADADSPTDADPKADAAPETGTGTGSEADAKPESGTDAKSDAKPTDAADAKTDAAPLDAKPDAGTDDGADAKEDARPEDRDGGDGPRVDQATAVFKAVRPKAPQVDQPTTMLKLGGKPRTPAPESERTSKFVALKNDLGPAPAKPGTAAPGTGKPAGDEPAAAAPAAAKPDVTTAVPQVGPERTTQQPLPPKPPLDLLAELTNTPPPPETPVRTAVRRVKIWTPLVLLLAIVLAVVQNFRPLPQPTLDLTAKDSYTFGGSDAKAGIPWPSDGQAALDVQGIGSFGSSGTQKPVPIASVAKVMTAYIILRDHRLKSGADGPKIKIDKTAEQQSNAGQESTVHVTAGDSISQREALESILIASANNVARLLARWDAGSEKAFVAKMNATAKDLGMTNSTYTDPSGLTDSTVSTAVDQVKLAKAAMTEPAFREVAAMMSYDDYKGENHSNWNHLVGRNNVVGIKTGTTTSALGNLVFAAKKDVGGETRTIVGAVLRQPAGGPENTILSAALDHSDKLIRAAQGALKSATILKKGDVVGYVDDGLGGRTPVVATRDVKAAGWSGLKVELEFAADEVPHTAKAGTQVGTLTVGDGSAGAVKVPVALAKDLAEPGLGAKLTRLG
ncbi:MULTISPECIES: D-alanyl-D-alanine carboxypeptidase [unclassified Streptomyces]|uniref:D-alanyl-D-alanine carboxypeptidase n=1 Tax=unclassified Streptomyces TaxID=2593676 RepID=UPI000B804069|nr:MULTISPECIES: D-alanyl-D-alanine carboxypeptidase [unclassified Streptomyces]